MGSCLLQSVNYTKSLNNKQKPQNKGQWINVQKVVSKTLPFTTICRMFNIAE